MLPRLSRVLADEVSHLSTDTYGTVSYMAPELLGQGKFGKPADVYSFGLLSASHLRLPHAPRMTHGRARTHCIFVHVIPSPKITSHKLMFQAYKTPTCRRQCHQGRCRPDWSVFIAQCGSC